VCGAQALWVGQGLFNAGVYSAGALSQARACFFRSLELCPNALTARLGLAYSAFHSDRRSDSQTDAMREAEFQLRKFLELNPSHAPALNLLVG
jgi:hypothetical protein